MRTMHKFLIELGIAAASAWWAALVGVALGFN